MEYIPAFILSWCFIGEQDDEESLSFRGSMVYDTSTWPSLNHSSCLTCHASSSTSFTVSTLTVTTLPTRRTIYCSSSSRLGSLTMPLRASVLTWYWSSTHSRAERLPRRY